MGEREFANIEVKSADKGALCQVEGNRDLKIPADKFVKGKWNSYTRKQWRDGSLLIKGLPAFADFQKLDRPDQQIALLKLKGKIEQAKKAEAEKVGADKPKKKEG